MAVCMAVKRYDRSCAEIIFLVKLYQRTVVDDLAESSESPSSRW